MDIITPILTIIPITATVHHCITPIPTIGIMTLATDILAIAIVINISTKDNYFFSLIANGGLNFQVAILICPSRRKVG